MVWVARKMRTIRTPERMTLMQVPMIPMQAHTIHMPVHMTPMQVPTIPTQERMTRTVPKIATARKTISRSTIKIVDV